MALFRFSKTQKYCATCQYWYGNRKVDSVWVPNFVIVEGRGAEEMGQCGHRQSGFWNNFLKANYTCSKWDLFARLKNL